MVVCTYNRAALLSRALASLVNQQARGKQYEIIVVDDGSTDDTHGVVRRVQQGSCIDIRYVRQPNAGIGNARNRGVAESRASWIAFLDDDELADENWLHELLSTAEASGADCVGGPSIPRIMAPAEIEPVGTVSMLLGQNPAMMSDSAKFSLFDRFRFRVTRISLPGGGNALIKRHLLNELGGFRPITYGEDLDLFRRAEQRGAQFASSQRARIYHLIPPQRLRSDYLHNLAKQGGGNRAGMDKERSMGGARFCAVLRLIHLCAITLPSICYNTAFRRRSALASSRCSMWFATAYIRTVIGSRNAT